MAATSKIIRLIAIVVVVLSTISVNVAARGAEGISVSLPLEGYYRPGEMMPVALVGSTDPSRLNQIYLSAEGAIPTTVQRFSPSIDGVFPWLIYSDRPGDFRMAMGEEKRKLDLICKPLAPDDRLIGVASARMPDDEWLGALFPGCHVIPVRIPVSDLTRGPVAAWGSLDALVIDASTIPRAQTNPAVDGWEKRIDRWLLEGITVAIRDGSPPDSSTIWTLHKRADGRDDWIGRLNIAGPRGYFSEEAYAPVIGWKPGRSVEFRRQLFLRAVCFVILVMALVLWRPRVAPVTIVPTALFFCAAVPFWERRMPVTRQRSGVIHVQHPGTAQHDHWNYVTSIKSHAGSASHPVFATPAQALRLNARLNCHAQLNGYVAFSYAIEPGEIVAELTRQRMPHQWQMQLKNPSSPLVRLAREAYAREKGPRIAGEIPDSVVWPLQKSPQPETARDTWNTIVVESTESTGAVR